MNRVDRHAVFLCRSIGIGFDLAHPVTDIILRNLGRVPDVALDLGIQAVPPVGIHHHDKFDIGMVGLGDCVHDLPQFAGLDARNPGHTDINRTALIGKILFRAGDQRRRAARGGHEIPKRFTKDTDFLARHVVRRPDRFILRQKDRTTIGLPVQHLTAGLGNLCLEDLTHWRAFGNSGADFLLGIEQERHVEDVDNRRVTDIAGQRRNAGLNGA